MFCVCTVSVPCAVRLGGMCRQNLCSGLAMIIAVNAGYVWELARVSCLRWHIL